MTGAGERKAAKSAKRRKAERVGPEAESGTLLSSGLCASLRSLRLCALRPRGQPEHLLRCGLVPEDRMTRRPFLTAVLALAAGGFAGCENQSSYLNPSEVLRARRLRPGDDGRRRRARTRPAADRPRAVRQRRGQHLRPRRRAAAQHVLARRGHGQLQQRPPALRDERDVPPGAVRIEELVNYFPYAYARRPATRATRWRSAPTWRRARGRATTCSCGWPSRRRRSSGASGRR